MFYSVDIYYRAWTLSEQCLLRIKSMLSVPIAPIVIILDLVQFIG